MGTRIGWRSATGCIRPAKRLERLIRGLSPGALAFLVLLAFARGPLDAADEAPNVRSQQNMEAAPAGVQSGQPPSGSPSLVIPGAQPSEDDRTLILPRSWRPTANEPTPPVPPPLAKVTVPDLLTGCWQGRPNDYDQLYSFQSALHLGRPGLVTACYHERTIDMDADIVVPAALRAVELVLTAGLGYTSFHAHGIQTDVYFVSPTVMRGRTVLEVQRTFRLAYVIPIPGSPQPTTVDWKATSVDRDTLRVEAYQVVWLSGQPSFGATWHADFKRIAEGAEGTSR